MRPPSCCRCPARANAHPSVATDGDVAVVAWSARGKGGTDVYAAVSADAGATFGRPVRVNTIAGEAVTSAERPPRVAIASTGGTRTIAVLWIGAAAAPAGPRMLLSQSSDGGRTFAAPIAVSAAQAPGIRGWASLAAGRDGAFHASWLDGRDAGAGAPAGAHEHHHAAAAATPAAAAAAAPHAAMRQDLYHAVIAADGSVAETRLATDVCFCCKTATLVPPVPLAGATLPGDVVVAWRHIYPNSERDIALAVRTAKTGLFAPPVRVSADHWQLQACPDDGPALAASGTGRLHAVWPSIADPAARDAGESDLPRAQHGRAHVHAAAAPRRAGQRRRASAGRGRRRRRRARVVGRQRRAAAGR